MQSLGESRLSQNSDEFQKWQPRWRVDGSFERGLAKRTGSNMACCTLRTDGHDDLLGKDERFGSRPSPDMTFC
jgi:hypothetical protein